MKRVKLKVREKSGSIGKFLEETFRITINSANSQINHLGISQHMKP